MITRWILPLAFVVLGVLILTGTILRQIPRGTGLRAIMGITVILLGIHRFVVSRTQRGDRRRFGGTHRRPWES
ncbi:MAG: hypothetical protein IPP40_00490 [bacterium]|nr:hypothetical protein [bacterium]